MNREKFQVGDLVERAEFPVSTLTIGQTYRVLELRDEGGSIRHLDDNGQSTWRASEYYRLARAPSAAEPEPESTPVTSSKPATVSFKGWGAWA